MKKKLYEKPTTKVVMLKQAPRLLNASKPDYLPEEW